MAIQAVSTEGARRLELSRRRFLLTAGALAGLAATTGAYGCSNVDTAPGGNNASEAVDTEAVIKSQCRMCHGTCGTLIHTRNGRVTKVEGYEDSPTNHGTLCVKGLSTIQHQYNPRRLRYPMKRIGERGEGKWERVSWDEAYEMIAEAYYASEPTQRAMSSGTGRHQQDWNGIFINAMGLRNSSFGMPPLCYLPRIQVSTKMFGYRLPVADYFGFKGDVNPGVVLFWGNNITNSHADGMSGSAPLRAINKGSKLICIDPVFTNVAAKAEKWLSIRPATDGALAMGFLHVIINEDLYDHEFVEQWSNLPGLVRDDTGTMLTEHDLNGTEAEEFHGPPTAILPPELVVFWDAASNSAVLADSPEIKPAMSGSFTVDLPKEGPVSCHTAWDDLVKRVNEYPTDKVAEITALKKEDIEEVARIIATEGPLALQWGVSFDQWGVNSADAIQAALMMIPLVGSLDVPGGMAMWAPLNYRKGSFPSELGDDYNSHDMYRADLLPAEVQAKGAEYSACPWGGGGANFYIEAVAKGEEDCQFLWVVGANPLHNTAETAQTLSALEKVGFIVVWDHYMTATAQMADLVMPVAIWTEMSRLADMHFLWGLQSRIKAVEPLGEARSDEMGCMGLARVLAKTDPDYWDEIIPWSSEEEWIDWRLEPMETTWNEFKEEWLHLAPQKPYSYKESKFLLPAGKAELFIRAKQQQGEDPLPRYREQPLYNLANSELVEKYPFLCVTRRVAGYFHTEYRQLPFIREIWPEPMIEINPLSAAGLGIAEGDWTVVETNRGKIKLKAKVTETVAPDVVCTEHDWWFPEVEEGTDPKLSGVMESNLSVIVDNDRSTGYDALIGTPILRGFFVNVYKSPDGPPKGLDPDVAVTWIPDAETEVD
ncbi:MAG: molybdopterin-dependent oxidoreductase [Coriobacteriales bacterium]|jgi:anaerobic selenocysteine-containing dehydrogenase|nr:molybdopterin-dependent oxidoreductase [Coriobacteriales bacterium]